MAKGVRLSSAAADSVDRALVEASVWKEIDSGRLPLELALEALRSFDEGNYNICTNAAAGEGLVVSVRNGDVAFQGDSDDAREIRSRGEPQHVAEASPQLRRQLVPVAARAHYAQIRTTRIIDAYLVGLAEDVRPVLKKLLTWMERQPEPYGLVSSGSGDNEDAWRLAV